MKPSDYLAWLGPIYLVAVSWPLILADVRERRLPNKYTLPVFPIATLGQCLAVAGGQPLTKFLIALLCAVIAFAAGVALNRYAGLGMGDVKLIAGITLSLAWFSPLLPGIALFIGLVIAGAVALFMVATRKTRMGSSIALGPYLLVGFVLSFIVQGWS
ncbi:MAG: prepilin peptidase [Rhodoluna sp.]